MAGGLSEGSIDKQLYTMRVPIELAKKICHKFAGTSTEDSAAYLAALEAAAKGVELTDADLAEIEDHKKRNLDDRMTKRAAHKARKAAAKAGEAGRSGVAK